MIIIAQKNPFSALMRDPTAVTWAINHSVFIKPPYARFILYTTQEGVSRSQSGSLATKAVQLDKKRTPKTAPKGIFCSGGGPNSYYIVSQPLYFYSVVLNNILKTEQAF